MRAIETTAYKFDELSDDAKKNAINEYRDNGYDNQHYYDEIIESVEAVVELFNLKTGREYTDIRYSHIDDNILQLSGARLYTYLMNNYGSELFTPKYIKTIDRKVNDNYRQFICKTRKTKEGKEYTHIYSRNFITSDCTLTGVCYDNDILQPVYDFLKQPDKSTTFADLISDIESAISKTFRTTEEWLNSDKFITEEIENNDYEFTENGELI